MTEGGSVWETGPQYPEMWPENADGTPSPPAVPPGAAEDVTPRTGSPVDPDAPSPPQREPAAPAPQTPAAGKGRRPPGWWQRTVLGFPVWMVLVFLAVVIAVFAVIALSGDPGSESTDRLQTVDSAVTTGPQPAAATTTTATASTTAPTTTVLAVTPTAVFTIPTDPPTTVAQTTAVPPTAAPTLPPATVAPTAAPTTAQAAATLPPDGPVVTIIGHVAPCDYGSECLLAGFTIHNFASQPTEFVCEFSDGSRYTFDFSRQEVERACATGDPTDSITIEVAGIRSATYVHP
ncbi:MAG TPA: hypothetical protein VF065_10955 [Ilumatobacter sp.]